MALSTLGANVGWQHLGKVRRPDGDQSRVVRTTKVLHATARNSCGGGCGSKRTEIAPFISFVDRMFVISAVGSINCEGPRPVEQRNKRRVKKCSVVLARIRQTCVRQQCFVDGCTHSRSTHGITMPYKWHRLTVPRNSCSGTHLLVRWAKQPLVTGGTGRYQCGSAGPVWSLRKCCSSDELGVV
jgi:hypothetical protein